MNKTRKILVTIGVGIFALIILPITIILLLPQSRDIEPEDYSRFDLQHSAPADADNFFDDLALFQERNEDHCFTLRSLTSSHENLSTPIDYATLGSEWETRKHLLQELLKLPSGRRLYDAPEFTIEESSPEIFGLMKNMSIFEAHTLLSIHKQDANSSLEAVSACRDYALYVLNDTHHLVDFHVGVAIIKQSLTLEQRLINAPEVSKETLENLLKQRDLESLVIESNHKALRGCFQLCKNAVETFTDDPENFPEDARWAPRQYVFHPNRTLKKVASHFDYGLSLVNSTPFNASKIPAPNSSERKNKTTAIGRNSVGEYLRDFLSPPIFRNVKLSWETVTADRLTLALAAVRLYHKNHGELPNSLADACNEAGVPVPHDIYAKKPNTPLLYSKADRKIWSVGNNFVNDNFLPDLDTLSVFKGEGGKHWDDYVIAIRVDKWNK